MSYLVYLNHYDIRQVEAQYLSVFYEVLAHGLNAHFILNKDYLKKYEKGKRWEVKWVENHWGSFEKVIGRLKSENYTIMEKPEKWIGSMEPSKLLSSAVYSFHEEEKRIIEETLKKKKIRAAVTWVNNRTLKEVLSSHNIPTIHHELGPFRPQTYIPTAYLDFSGVNGNTEFNSRFQAFLKIANEVPILSREELIRIISPNHYKRLIDVLHDNRRTHDIGVGLQVEVDTNLLLFNRGCNWVDPLLKAQADSTGKVLARPHPAAGYILKSSARIEINDITKEDAIDFINRCNKVYCLNSSVGLEAVLLGREAKIFGDSPFTEVCIMDEDTQLKALNFAIFGYLIHRSLLFDEKYYDFRLNNIGNEKAVYLDNMKRLLNSAKKN